MNFCFLIKDEYHAYGIYNLNSTLRFRVDQRVTMSAMSFDDVFNAKLHA